MSDRFTRFPADLARRARAVRLGPAAIPALLAHPDWRYPAPTVIWLHGRTVTKELDPGRYLRWVRAGIAACAIDLPGHGQRAVTAMQHPARTLDVLEQVLPEIDQVIEALADPVWSGRGASAASTEPGTTGSGSGAGNGGDRRDGGETGVFDLDRLAIGGMSAGGMAALRRLCDPHPFRCAAVEGTTGDLAGLYFGDDGRRWPVAHDAERVARLDPTAHLGAWRPIPLLALHAEHDRVVPITSQRRFIDALRAHYRDLGADDSLVSLVTFPHTGAPEEHAGFGRFANDAKNVQTDFLVRWLRPSRSAP